MLFRHHLNLARYATRHKKLQAIYPNHPLMGKCPIAFETLSGGRCTASLKRGTDKTPYDKNPLMQQNSVQSNYFRFTVNVVKLKDGSTVHDAFYLHRSTHEVKYSSLINTLNVSAGAYTAIFQSPSFHDAQNDIVCDVFLYIHNGVVLKTVPLVKRCPKFSLVVGGVA